MYPGTLLKLQHCQWFNHFSHYRDRDAIKFLGHDCGCWPSNSWEGSICAYVRYIFTSGSKIVFERTSHNWCLYALRVPHNKFSNSPFLIQREWFQLQKNLVASLNWVLTGPLHFNHRLRLITVIEKIMCLREHFVVNWYNEFISWLGFFFFWLKKVKFQLVYTRTWGSCFTKTFWFCLKIIPTGRIIQIVSESFCKQKTSLSK
jgi:hypothetical protein